MAQGITMCVAAYNERETIVETIREITRAVEGLPLDAELLLIDDASRDGTEAFCRQAAALSPIVRAVRNPVNLGFGGVYRRGLELATREWYMALPGDNAYAWQEIHAMLRLVGEADMVVPYTANLGSRRLSRRWLSRAFTRVMNRISGHRLRYYNGPVIHRTDALRELGDVTSSFAFQAEILCRRLNRGASFVEVGVQVRESRDRKSSALRPKNVVNVAKTLWRLSRTSRQTAADSATPARCSR